MWQKTRCKKTKRFAGGNRLQKWVRKVREVRGFFNRKREVIFAQELWGEGVVPCPIVCRVRGTRWATGSRGRGRRVGRRRGSWRSWPPPPPPPGAAGPQPTHPPQPHPSLIPPPAGIPFPLHAPNHPPPSNRPIVLPSPSPIPLDPPPCRHALPHPPSSINPHPIVLPLPPPSHPGGTSHPRTLPPPSPHPHTPSPHPIPSLRHLLRSRLGIVGGVVRGKKIRKD